MMKNQIKLILILLFFSLFAFVEFTIAYDSDNVHPIINREALKNSYIDSYLKENLKFDKGIDEIFNGKRVREWIVEGGKKEDDGTRYKNHFHDPTKDWDSAGLDSFLANGQSSLLWIHKDDNKWSWLKTREYFYKALSGETEEEREESFADCFRALGQVMHLVADLSVPAHVRNDVHIGKRHYETWCEHNSSKLNTTAINLDDSIFSVSSVQDFSPISNLWDTYPSSGYSPVIADPSNTIGLAEYVNYNFLSKDTVFKEYEYPKRSDMFTVFQSVQAEDDKYDNLVYFSSETTDSKCIDYFAATDYLLTDWEELNIPPEERINVPAHLDDNCFQNYAEILVPKAVSYTTSLLDYFFRGELEVEQKGITSSGYIILNVTNNSSEPMADGYFELYYDNDQGIRTEIDLYSGLSKGKYVHYLDAGDKHYMCFPPPVDFETDKENKYILVYKGGLGNESEAVIGKNFEIKYTYAVVFFIDRADLFDYPEETFNIHQDVQELGPYSNYIKTWNDEPENAELRLYAYYFPLNGIVNNYGCAGDNLKFISYNVYQDNGDQYTEKGYCAYSRSGYYSTLFCPSDYLIKNDKITYRIMQEYWLYKYTPYGDTGSYRQWGMYDIPVEKNILFGDWEETTWEDYFSHIYEDPETKENALPWRDYIRYYRVITQRLSLKMLDTRLPIYKWVSEPFLEIPAISTDYIGPYSYKSYDTQETYDGLAWADDEIIQVYVEDYFSLLGMGIVIRRGNQVLW